MARENPRVEPPPPAAEPAKRENPPRRLSWVPSPTVAASAIKPNPGGQVHSTGFDVPSATAPDVKLPTAAVGAFEAVRRQAASRDQGTDRSTRDPVADAGFGAVAPAAAAFGHAFARGRGGVRQRQQRWARASV